MALQHLRSSTANKRPTPAGMSDGQLALNTNDASPGLFFKDSNGALVKVGPVHVGTTAPNATPGSGGSSGNAIGEQWLDTTGGAYVFKVWDGSAWRSESGTFVDVNGDVMTGALGIIAGSAGSPGLYFSGDTNTGIYSPGADQLAISTNSTGRLFIDSSGKVGIGATPEATLHVAGSASGAYIAQIIQNQNAGGYSQQIFRVGTGAGTKEAGISYAPGIFLAIGPTANDTTTPIVFHNNNAQERLRITSAGLVGVGTSSPSNLLEVSSASNSYIRSTTTTNSVSAIFGAYTSTVDVGSTTNHSLNFYTAGVNRATLDTSGRLGVGTTTPGSNLDLAGTTSRIRWDVNNAYTLATHGNAGFSAFASSVQSAADYQFQIAGIERARIDSSGRVGIGTSSPAYNAHITNSGAAGTLSLHGSSGVGYLLMGNADTSSGPVVIYSANQVLAIGRGNSFSSAGGGTVTESVRIDASGRVGIGTTSPTFAVGEGLEIERDSSTATLRLQRVNTGGSILEIRADDAKAVIDSRQASTDLAFQTNSLERLRIDSSGRLLVGTSSARSNFFNSTVSPLIQQEGISGSGRFMSVTYGTASEDDPIFILGKHRGASIGGNTVVANGDGLGKISFQGSDGSELVEGAAIRAEVDGTPGANDMPGRIVLSTTADGASSPTERMRIDSTGRCFFNTTASPSTTSFGTSIGTVLAHSRDTSTGAVAQIYGSAGEFRIIGSGNAQNTNNSYGAISDQSFKTDISDAGSQWNDIKGITVRKFKLIGTDTLQIGVVAQECEMVSPGLVEDTVLEQEDGTTSTVKAVKYSVLYMKAVKALQEAMERIEQLEQRLAAAGI